MKHDREFEPTYGSTVEILPGLRRLTARNPGPFTFHGTNTYLCGEKNVIVIDPGPDDPQHVEAILRATEDARIEAILVSHTHVDHSPAARLLSQKTAAPIIGCAPHESARPLQMGETNPMDSSADRDYQPDKLLKHGETIKVAGQTLEAVHTPGHTQNHLCFALKGTEILFSADHVMAWSTSIVAPPDGCMKSYMASMDVLLERKETTYLPGHGPLLREAHAYVRQLKNHRLRREASILDNLGPTPTGIPDLVLIIYKGLDPNLRPAAALSLFAHLEDLVERGTVIAEPRLDLNASYRLA